MFTIHDDYDPDAKRVSADSDPVAAWLIYREHVRLGAVGDIGLSLEDFRQHIAQLRKRRPLG